LRPNIVSQLGPIIGWPVGIPTKVYEVDNLVNLCHSDIAMATTIENRISRMHLPSRERAMVSELTHVMRRYADQTPTRLAHLMNLAFGVTIGGGKSREQKLAQAQVRGLEVRQQLVEAEGGSWSSEEVARLLHISKTAVLKRLASDRLLAWREERLQAARFPRWQFDDHGHVLNGLEAVLDVLGRDARLDAWGKMLFFLQEKPGPGERHPLDLLRQGKMNEARLAAEGYAE
jgi:hypothetical protein